MKIPGRSVRLALAFLALSAGLPGQEAAKVSSEDCAACHERRARAPASARPARPPPFNAAALRASPHAGLDCTACHADIKEFRTPRSWRRVDCGGCHSDEQKQYAASLHGRKAAAGDR